MLCFDYRCFGNSDGEPRQWISVPRQLQDWEAAIAHARSLPGVDPEALALPLSYLHHNHLAPEEYRPVAVPDRYVNMNLLPADEIDPRRAVRDLPPMIRGYLRLGGQFGDGAVVDYEFNTTDVCVVVEMSLVTDKYLNHYLRDTELGEKRRSRDADS